MRKKSNGEKGVRCLGYISSGENGIAIYQQQPTTLKKWYPDYNWLILIHAHPDGRLGEWEKYWNTGERNLKFLKFERKLKRKFERNPQTPLFITL